MGLTRRQRLRHVVVPGALPQALVGLRQSLGVAWLSLIVAETVSADSGLGYMINHAREFLQTDVIVVGLAVYSMLGLATDALVRLHREEGAGMALLNRPTIPVDARRPPRPSPGWRHHRSFGSTHVLRGARPDRTTRRVRRPARPERLRQVDPAAQPGRPRPRTRPRRSRSPAAPRSPSRSRGCCRGARVQAQRRAGAAQHGPARARAPRTRRARARRGQPHREGRRLAAAPCPADRPSASRWPAPWSASPTCCCSTSRSARSTR